MVDMKMPVTHCTGHPISYRRIAGAIDRPTLIFLHEGLGCSAMWKSFPDQLCRATGCPGLLYDRPGHGQSAPLTIPRTIHFLHHHALVELPVLLQELLPEGDYILLGHSDGGSIALIAAAEQPALLRGVITEAAHVFVEQETLTGVRSAVEAFERGKLNGLARYHMNNFPGVFAAWSGVWLSLWFAAWNIEYLLSAIDCPVLALQGEDDQYGTSKQLAAIQSGCQHAEIVMLPDCGHAPHAAKPQASPVSQASQNVHEESSGLINLLQSFIAKTSSVSTKQR